MLCAFHLLLLVTRCSLKACSYIICSIFFHSPLFCMLFLLFLPFLQSSVPVCRHHGDDRTSSSRLVSHSCFIYFLSAAERQGKPGRKRNAVFKGTHAPNRLISEMHHDFLMLDITLSLVIFVVSSVANGCSVRLRPPLWWQALQGVHHTFLLTYKTIPNRGIHETSKNIFD